jgi:hypothetical protein
MSRKSKETTHHHSLREAVIQASRAVSKMPAWKTDGFDKREVIVLRTRALRGSQITATKKS